MQLTTVDNEVIEDKLSADDCRMAIVYDNEQIHVTENELDIFSHSSIKIPDWQPSVDLPSYNDVSKVYLDIETTGLDPKVDSIKMIGLMNESGRPHLIRHDSEKEMLEEFIKVVTLKKPYMMCTFNGMKFDLPFMHERFKRHKIKSPFFISDRESCFRTAQKFGQPTFFNAVHFKIGNYKVHHIDVYQQVLAYDFVARKLTAHNLKEVPLQMGLRKEARLDLGYQGLLDCYANGDWETVSEYLKYDLEDTKLIADVLIPAVYYQQLFFTEFNFQALSTMGNATKWNSFLRNQPEYKSGFEKGEYLPDKKYRFRGAITTGKAGFFQGEIMKIDVASLYPTIMLNYAINTKKDEHNYLLAVLNYARNMRLHFKTKANRTSEDKQMDGGLKVIINSCYGFLGAIGDFNDYEAAAMVTAYGRNILMFMVSEIEKHNGNCVSIDTDGVYFSCDKGQGDYIYEQVQKALPQWIKIDSELKDCVAFFVPPVDVENDYNKSYKVNSCNGQKFIRKIFAANDNVDEIWEYALENYATDKITFELLNKIADELYVEFQNKEGLRKNYIMIFADGKVKSKGRFVKRDRCKLEKTFQIDYLKKYHFDGVVVAEKFYQETLESIQSCVYPVQDVSITRKIRKGEKTIVEAGLGNQGDQVTFYQGDNGATNTEPYSANHYTALVAKLKHELDTVFGYYP